MPNAPLPRAIPPRWMNRSLAASLLLMAVLGGVALLMPVEEKVVAGGIVDHGGSTSLYAPAAAKVIEILRFHGAMVEEGALLARLENPELADRHAALVAEREVARAAVATEEARMRKVVAAPLTAEFLFSAFEVERQTEATTLQEAFLKKLEAIEKTGAASQVEVLNLRLQLLANEAQLRRSRAASELLEGPFGGAARDEARLRLEESRALLSKTEQEIALCERRLAELEIRAPVAGKIVASTRRDPGERVEAGEELFEMASGEPARLSLRAPADRLHLIREGLAVRFRAASDPDPLLPPGRAKVIRVDRATAMPHTAMPEATGVVASTLVRAKVDFSPSPLRPDVPVTAEVLIGSRPLWQLLLLKAARRSEAAR